MHSGDIVFIIGSDEASRQMIRDVAESLGYSVESYGDADEFVARYSGHNGCIVTELQGEQVSGPEIMRALSRNDIVLPTVLMTQHPQTSLIVQVMKWGAVTVLEKPFHPDAMAEAIHEAMARGATEQSDRINRRMVRERMARLSDSERKVMELMVDGLANKVIAKRLKVSIRTVESRRHEVFAKMEVKSLAELVRTVVQVS